MRKILKIDGDTIKLNKILRGRENISRSFQELGLALRKWRESPEKSQVFQNILINV